MPAHGKLQAAQPGSWRRDFRLNWKIYLIAMPIIAYFVVFHYLPMFGLSMAFQDFNPIKGFLGSPWVGFDNFIKFFTGASFLVILRNTLVISLLKLFIGFPLTIIFALLLNELNILIFKKAIQTISYMPYFVSMVVIAGLIIDFCSSNGVITNLLVSIGLKRQNLLQNPNFFWGINLVSDLWQGLGYGSIIFIAAISNVSQELHEAATIDGAGRFKRAFYVTIPGIMPVIITMLILNAGMLMSVGFDKILLLYNPTIYSTADVISTHVQRLGIVNMQYGYSSAVGFFNSVVGTALLLITNYISRKHAEQSVF